MTRTVSWWPGSVRSGDVHVHHLVWGICLMMLSGFLSFAAPPAAPWGHLIAVVFGVGAGFTIDEFALWVHLEDVYWEEEGRTSLDATVVTVAFAALVVLGTTPFGLDGRPQWRGPPWSWPRPRAVGHCFMKGRILSASSGCSSRPPPSWARPAWPSPRHRGPDAGIRQSASRSQARFAD